MRETNGRQRRVSNKLKAALIAMLAVFAFSALGATNAGAAQTLKLSFNDSWIKVDALDASFHALDPADPAPKSVDLTGSLADDGAFLSKKEDFSFPSQTIPSDFGQIQLDITAATDITGNFNKASGVFNGQLPLALTIIAIGQKCQISPLNIPLSTTGSNNFGSTETPNVLAATPFAGNNGAVIGSWTDVTGADVKGVPPTSDTICQTLIDLVLAGEESFDGSIWLKGTSTVEGSNLPATCDPGFTGTPPNCVEDEPVEMTPYKVNKVVISPKKGRIKAGKKMKLKIKVTNSGETAGSSSVSVKSSNKKVTVPKTVKISVPAGGTVSKTITVKASKKAKGKANITAKASGKSATAKLTVKKAKKKKK